MSIVGEGADVKLSPSFVAGVGDSVAAILETENFRDDGDMVTSMKVDGEVDEVRVAASSDLEEAKKEAPVASGTEVEVGEAMCVAASSDELGAETKVDQAAVGSEFSVLYEGEMEAGRHLPSS